jgi:hypothetical protein
VLCLKGNADDTQFAQPLRGEKKKTTWETPSSSAQTSRKKKDVLLVFPS